MQLILKISLLILLFVRVVTIKDGSTTVSGLVLKEPAVYESTQQVTVKNQKFYLPKYPEIKYGDYLKIDNGELVSLQKSDFFLFKIRNQIIQNNLQYLPKTNAAILAGVVLGSQQSISDSFWEKLKESGTAHIVVASGTNVTYTAVFLLSIFLTFTKRKKAVILSIIGIWVYVALSGFDPPLVRAAIMGSVTFFAQLTGRVTESLNSLLISVIAMLLINPAWIRDVGFALSFYATASLILFESDIYLLISKVPDIIRKDLSTTLTAQIGVAPILYITFKQFNIFSPIYNVLVLWTIPPIMILGAISGFVGLFNFSLGKMVALLTYPLTSWFIFIVNI